MTTEIQLQLSRVDFCSVVAKSSLIGISVLRNKYTTVVMEGNKKNSNNTKGIISKLKLSLVCTF